MNRRDFLVAGGAGSVALAAPGVVSTSCAAETLKVTAFAGASNLPIWAGLEKGFFTEQNVAPTLEITPGSIQLAKDLHGGKVDLALTAFDNTVAYVEGVGEADLDGPAQFVALFGIDDGMLSFMADPSIGSFADLKGKTVSVDAMTTGFAFVTLEMMARNGIKESDVTFAKVGGGAQRLEALLKKEQNATILNSPLDLIAEAKGFKRLLRARDILPAYQGISATTSRDTLARKRATIAAFTRGFHKSVAWVAANRDEAVRILTEKMKGMDKAGAERAFDRLLDPTVGMFRDLRIDLAGVKTVLELRSRHSKSGKQLGDASKYIDATFLPEALKG